MKKIKILLPVVFLVALLSNVYGQENNYSILVVKRTFLKQMKAPTVSYEIKHNVGNGKEIDLTKDRLVVTMNDIVDVLNELYKQGWKVVSVETLQNLKSDDQDTSMGNQKEVTYYQYLLAKN